MENSKFIRIPAFLKNFRSWWHFDSKAGGFTQNAAPLTAAYSLLVAAFFLYLIPGLWIGSPVMGSDEYAFFAHGKFFTRRPELLSLDPYMQRVSNIVYFAILHLWTSLGLGDPTLGVRIIHAFECCLSAFLLYRAFKASCESKYLLLGLAGTLLLPHACYNFTILPEMEMVLAGALVGYLVIVQLPRRPHMAAFLVGAVTGVALLIKPHAVAILGSAVLAIYAGVYFGVLPRQKYLTVRLLLIVIATAYCFAVVSWRLCNQEWTANPKAFLSMGFYGKYLSQETAFQTMAAKIWSMFKYGSAHFAFLVLVFAPALMEIVRGGKRLLLASLGNGVEEKDRNYSMAILFATIMLVVHVAMTAYFTAGSSALSTGEAMRLHGRYLGPVLIFLPFFYFNFVRNKPESTFVILAPVFAIAILVNQFVVFRLFKIYPWDYPMLYGFFTYPNHYQWTVNGVPNYIGYWLMLAIVLGLVVMLAFKKHGKIILTLLLFAILSAGFYQTMHWMLVHTTTNQELTQYSRAISMMLKDRNMGRGVFISDERFGSMSYVLYGLANSPKVIVREPASRIEETDVSGADWVLFGKDYVVGFAYNHAVNVGPFTFFPLKTNVANASNQNDPKAVQP